MAKNYKKEETHKNKREKKQLKESQRKKGGKIGDVWQDAAKEQHVSKVEVINNREVAVIVAVVVVIVAISVTMTNNCGVE